ncbi:MAG: exopolysaccharide biosynthesis polyprenyl glycosylphosphotransferase [Methylovirgula sp.]
MYRVDTAAESAKPFAPPRRNTAPAWKKTLFVRGGFPILAVLADFAAIQASGFIARVIYAAAGVPFDTHIRLGLLVAVLFTFMSAMRGEYAITNYLTFEDQVRHTVAPWCMALVGAMVISLSMKPLTDSTVLALATFLLGGFCALNFVRLVLTYCIRAKARQGKLAVRRILLFGYEDELRYFSKRHEPWLFGIHIAAASVLRTPDSLEEDLALALASARLLEPDDVFILAPWSDKKVIDAAIQAFLRIPASIHLGSERVLERFADARVSKIGHMSSLNLVRDPLSPPEVFAKRLFDIVCAAIGLVLLAPLLLAVALAIKLDSPGPIFFAQRRYGFNQQPFRMFKFRSMHTLEDDANLKLVVNNDTRVTRVGDFIRSHNIDELPQLFNVLRGEMSLVGPRPHALCIDQKFAERIALYARRHNVKPGITGWAQINGLRGGMRDDAMRARVEHDLYYIDHWSMWFDLEILWMTIASEKAYVNAL